MRTLDEAEVTDPNPANRRRSERVMLQVPVVVQVTTREGKEVRENTHTVVVNAHGGLLKLKMEVLIGQPLVIVNPKNKFEQSGHVTRIEESGPEHFAVAFEFDEPAPNFWPIVFPPADWVAPVL